MKRIQYDTTPMEDNAVATSSKAIPKSPTDRNAFEYNMNHKNRGMALIFNHREFDKWLGLSIRDGTDEDCARLNEVLKNLDFDVAVHKDLCRKEIWEQIENAASKDHTDNDCILIAIFSHGGEGHIYAKDTHYKLNHFLNYFTANNCPTLAGKPKLFFVQACQGKERQEPFEFQAEGSIAFDSSRIERKPLLIPDSADFLIYYSTIPGFTSVRYEDYGSWFIQSLCQELEDNAKRYDLMTMLTFVNRRVANNFEYREEKEIGDSKKVFRILKQMPSIDSRLRHLVYFNQKSKSTSTSQEKKT